MKKVLLLFICSHIAMVSFAQTQQGYVKTKGRMDAKGNLIPGQGLKGATVSVQGRTAMLVNNDDGKFSFPVTESQFRLDSVKKKGYQLVDMEACPRTYKYSSNPLYVVMETPEQQLQDQLNAERKIRRNLQKQLQEREDEIESLMEQQQISDEEYRLALQKLYQEQESNEKLISDMAKRYSELDYDQLDEFYRQVSYFIENGELVKADSLLKTRGDITAQVADIKQRGQTIADQDEQLQKAKAVQQADIDEAARRCYSYSETFRVQHLNDSAAYYLELMVSLDTTNLDWILEAGKFNDEYLVDHDKAFHYYHMGLRQAQRQFGEEHSQTAWYYDLIGIVYLRERNYDEALEYLTKALTIRQIVFGEDHSDVALSYNNIAAVLYEQGRMDEALEHHQKALVTRKAIHGETHEYVAQSYHNLGNIYYLKGDIEKALEYQNNALDIRKTVYGENHQEVAISYLNISIIYYLQGDYNKAIEYNRRSLNIWKGSYGENHPYVGQCYFNIGCSYDQLEVYDKALENLNNALVIFQSIPGDNHTIIAITNNNIGYIYYKRAEYTRALEYYNNALDILIPIYGEEYPDVAANYNNIGCVYRNQGDYRKALEYYQKVLEIHEKTLGADHPLTLQTKEQISEIEAKMNETEK